MGVYVLTVFEKDGSKALDESFEAATEKKQKQKVNLSYKKSCMKKHIAVHLLQVSSFYSSAKKASSASFHSTISSSHHVNTTSRMRLPIRTRLFHFPVWI